MISFKKKVDLYHVFSVNSSESVQGILLHLGRITLKRKMLFIYQYEVVEDLKLFKPNLNLFTSNFPEDSESKGLSDVWLKVNSLFENFREFQFDLRILHIYQNEPVPMIKLFNQYAKK